MSHEWVDWSNPVALWWSFLLAVSAINIMLWIALRRYVRRTFADVQRRILGMEVMLLLCAAYVFGCAFRSILPRADVQRICLFDTWLSSVLVGRSVATIAEICFAIQCAIVLRHLANLVQSRPALAISNMVVPLIVVAEFCSWYAVITTSYLGNTVENSIWALAFGLIAVALLMMLTEFHGVVRAILGIAIAGIAGYLAFLVTIDVPMYFTRWQADVASGKELLGLFSGLHDLGTRWTVTRDVAHWRDEIAWMSLYFSTAVWASLGLVGVTIVQHHLPRYRSVRAYPRRPLPANANSAGPL